MDWEESTGFELIPTKVCDPIVDTFNSTYDFDGWIKSGIISSSKQLPTTKIGISNFIIQVERKKLQCVNMKILFIFK